MKNSVAVKELRDRTGMSFGLCQSAWNDSGGNMEQALVLLEEKGATRSEKLSDRTTNTGFFGVYRHHDGSLVSVVQLCCETDFVSGNSEFRTLADNLAMHVASSDTLSLEKILKQDMLDSGTTVDKMIKNLSAKTGENIVIGAITRLAP